jgi:hypothetical protein
MQARLTTCAPATRRLVLLASALQHPEVHRAVTQRLQDRAWVPTPEECPVVCSEVETWYVGVQRTATMVMDSYERKENTYGRNRDRLDG